MYIGSENHLSMLKAAAVKAYTALMIEGLEQDDAKSQVAKALKEVLADFEEAEVQPDQVLQSIVKTNTERL